MHKIFPRFERGIWALVGVQLITSAGFSLALPFLSLYLNRERGLAMSLVGTVMLCAAFAEAFGQVLGGELSDRLGRRPVLLGSLLFRLLAFLGMAWLLAAKSPVWLIICAYLALRVTRGVSTPPISALVADLTKEKRVEGYGILRVGANVGWAMGPAVGGYLATFFPYAVLFIFGGAATFLALLLAGLAVPEPPFPTRQNRPETLPVVGDRAFLGFLGLSLPVFLVAGQLVSTLSVFLVERLGLSEAQFGGLLTLNGLLVVATQYPIARIVQTRSPRLGLALGSFLYAVGYLSFGWIRAYPLMILAMIVVTVGEMIFTPVAMAIAAGFAREDQRGRYLGAFGLVQSFGWSGGAFLGGVLLDYAPSPQVLWGALTSLGFLAAFLFLSLGKLAHSALEEKPARALDQQDRRA